MANLGFAKTDAKHPHHSFFNSTLLNQDEMLIDLIPVGTFVYGVNSSLEIGTAGTLLLGGSPNLILKHRMFDLGRNQTSFTSITGYFPKKHLQGSDDEDLELLGFYSLHGVVDGYKIDDQWTLNLGVMHGYALLDSYQNLSIGRAHSRTTLDVYAALLGFDYSISDRWHLNMFSLVPIYFNLGVVSDVGDGEASVYSNLKRLQSSFVSNFSLVRSWETFHFEAGFFHVGSLNTPYISAIWRFS